MSDADIYEDGLLSVLALLKRSCDQEVYYIPLSYRHCLYCDSLFTASFDEPASNYFKVSGPEEYFKFPHLYGFLELVSIHHKASQQLQDLILCGSGICAFDQLGKAITHFARGIVNDCVLNSLHSSIILLTTFFTTFGVEEPANCLAIKCSIYRTEACAFVGCKFDASYQSFVAGSSWQIPKICVEMLLGMNETLKRALYLDNIDAFDYIYRSTTTRSFDECIKCFLSLGFSQEELDDIFKVLAICIHLETARRAAKGQNITETLDYASNLMGVPKSILISSFDSHLNISEWIFHSTLKWVLSKLDRKLSPPRSSRHWLNIWTPSSSIMSEDQNVAIKEAESFYKKLMLPVMENTFLFNILKDSEHGVRSNSAIDVATMWRLSCISLNVTCEPGVFDPDYISYQLLMHPRGLEFRKIHGIDFASFSENDFRALFMNHYGVTEEKDVLLHMKDTGVPSNEFAYIGSTICCSRRAILALWHSVGTLVTTTRELPTSRSDNPHFDKPSQSCVREMITCVEMEAKRMSIDEKRKLKHSNSRRKTWLRFSRLASCFVPDTLLTWCGLCQTELRDAWREKVALVMIILLISFIMLFFIVGLSLIICPEQKIMTMKEFLALPKSNPHVIIHGIIYDVSPLTLHHSSGLALPHHIYGWAGRDASSLFPHTPMYKFSKQDPLYAHDLTRLVKRSDIIKTSSAPSKSSEATKADASTYMHSTDHLTSLSALPRKWMLAIPREELSKSIFKQNAKVAIFGAVYDISTIIDNWGHLSIQAIRALKPPWGVDKSKEFHGISLSDLEILNKYLLGVLDNRDSVNCRLSEFILIGSTVLLALVMITKFLAALQFGTRRDPEDIDKFVVILVPCFTEDEDTLRKTIDSLATLDYDDKRKLLFIVADGMIVGTGNERPTPEILSSILGVKEDCCSEIFLYSSILEDGQGANFAKVYSGLYECSGHYVPFILVIKVGLCSETGRPGNRGKRDSQMILLRFLSNIHHGLPLNPLEMGIYHHINSIIGVDPEDYEYLLMVDADTQVFGDSLVRMVSSCANDTRIMGICGETRLSNEKATWVTMIQVYEYYISHHLAKAFESLFGTVTCLPGCFCLYRLRSPKFDPLIIKRELLDEYLDDFVDTLHKKNLMSLGEDRFLTTLMLKHFPKNKTKFIPDASCLTVAPEKWTVLLSQRRRWINSTIHNLLELVLLPDLCGFCCLSMRFIVLVDLYATLVMPASVIYLAFLILGSIHSKTVPLVSLILLAAVYGMQILVFLMKRQWQHIGWMIIHLLAMPLFGFAIPLYAFWHFDDFTWGSTRRIAGKGNGFGDEFRSESDNLLLHMKTRYVDAIKN